MIWLEGVALGCVALVVYSYALYPFVLALLAGSVQLVRDARYVLGKRDRRMQQAPQDWPSVAVVISAYNEQLHLQGRIDNLLALDYPPSLLRCYIGSDGSSDATASILQACTDARIQAHVFEHNRGKASVLNDLVARTTEAVLVFSDANTFFHADALKRLVKHFDHPRCGVREWRAAAQGQRRPQPRQPVLARRAVPEVFRGAPGRFAGGQRCDLRHQAALVAGAARRHHLR